MTEVEDEELERGKKIAYYSTLLDAWITNRMETDRTLLALSIGGIGLLFTLLSTVGPSSVAELWFYGLAGVSFVVTAVAAILTFHYNAGHIEDVLKHGIRQRDSRLRWLDRCLMVSFALGVLLTMGLAGLSGYTRMQERIKERDTMKKSSGNDGGRNFRESLSGVGNLAPTEKKSLNSIGNLAPSPSPARAPGGTTPAPANSTAQSTTNTNEKK